MRRRSTVQEPVPDYHDTARPGHEKSRRCVRLATSAATAENSDSLLCARTNIQEAPAMSHTTATPTRPASIPPRFAPVPDPLSPRTVAHFEADVRDGDHLTASAVMDADGRCGVRYFLRLDVEGGTATEIRDALAEALEWWTAQESHLDGPEVTA